MTDIPVLQWYNYSTLLNCVVDIRVLQRYKYSKVLDYYISRKAVQGLSNVMYSPEIMYYSNTMCINRLHYHCTTNVKCAVMTVLPLGTVLRAAI